MKNTEVVDKKGTVGVVVARVHTPDLHEGHTSLINYVVSNHPNVMIFLGIPRIQNTKKNSLDFPTRKLMVQEMYPNAIVLPLNDINDDFKWSHTLDSQIRSIFPEKKAILYGSRDSFLPSYHGTHETEEFPQVSNHNATEIRAMVADKPLPSRDFRCGVIYGIAKQRPVTYPTVDVVVVDGDKILLARKPSETLFRFVGGFVDRTDENWEMAARRELYEETKLSALKMEYVCSQAIQDWRYKGLDSGIMTTLFMTHAWDQMGIPMASDDIQEVKWFNIKDFYTLTSEKNQGDGHVPKKMYDFNIKDKIVPEHVTLMENFILKIFKDEK
jgi:bifunctional NMN adenylyltransferase/nudix hydrolase